MYSLNFPLESSDESVCLSSKDNIYQSGKKLQAYFPFDPYPLPNSAHHLNAGETYLKWKDRKMEVAVDSLLPGRREGGGMS